MRIGDVFRTADREPQLFLGRIKSGPDSIDEGVKVIVDTFDSRQEWGPCPWTPRGDDWPSTGDRALIARVGTETWVLGWFPR